MGDRKKFGIPYQELARINGIKSINRSRLACDFIFHLRQKTHGEFLAYVEPLGGTVSEALETSARKAAPYLTYLTPFAYLPNRDGSLTAPPLNQFPAIARANKHACHGNGKSRRGTIQF